MSEQSFQIVGHKMKQNQELTQNNKIFAFQNGDIQYTNFEQTKFQEQKSLQIIVHNYLSYQQKDKIIKITQIIYEDKILRIKDQLKITNHFQNQKQEIKRSIGKFGRRNNYSDPTKQQKSDTKNLIKNIINIFINWLHKKNTEQTNKTIRKVKQIVKKIKYFNRILIQQLSKDKDICLCFIQFNQTDSQALIENSRIRDKQCHHKAIKNYTKLFIESKSKLNQGK